MDATQWRYCPRCASSLEHREREGRVRPVCPSCGFVYFADPKVTVGVVVEREGRVLLGKRSVDPRRGLWCLPGGFVDYGERLLDAAVREVLEETGMSAEIGELLGVWDFDESVDDKRGIALFFAASAEGEPRAADDLEEVGWFPLDDLPPIAFAIHRAVLETWAARRSAAVTKR